MAKEIEVKILNVDVPRIREVLQQNNAQLIRPMYKQKRYVFDIKPGDKSRWIRLRSDGTKTTLAVKVIKNDLMDGTNEFETSVSDLRATLEILRQLGYKPKSYQENYRELYEFQGAAVSIDFWPKVSPYLEIEADSKQTVTKVLNILNPDKKPTTSANTIEVYKSAGIDLDKRKNLIFSQAEEKSISQPVSE